MLCVRAQADHAGVLAALALSAYKHQHGAYPETLSALVPEYLSAIPIDPFSDEPLCYRLDERDGYVLYSVGENGIDDGGVCRGEDGAILSRGERKDWGLPVSRGEPRDEWVLVPIDDGGESGHDG